MSASALIYKIVILSKPSLSWRSRGTSNYFRIAVKHPAYDRAKYDVWALPNLTVWHWLLNPGIAMNELILGMRIPEVMLVDRTSEEPITLRTYVPCPHCGTLHHHMLWGKGNAFGHWYGYLCPTCGKIIPCLRNWTSKMILIITCPFWFLPARLLKPRWLAYEKFRLNRDLPKILKVPSTARIYKRAFIGGLGWGLCMWLAMDAVPFLYHYWTNTDRFINIGPLVYGLPICLGLGLVWGFFMGIFMKFFINLRGKKGVPPSNDPH